MAKLKTGPLDSLDGIEAGFCPLYEQMTTGEHAGKYILTGVEHGFAQVKALKDEAGGYRIKLKDATTALATATTSLAAWGELKPEEVNTQLARITELEASATGKVPEAKLNELAEARANAKMAPLQRELATLKKDNETALGTIKTYKDAANTTAILEAVRGDAGPLGFQELTYAKDGALALMALNLFKVDETGNVVAKEGSGFTPGLPPKEVLPELLVRHPYLGKTSEGGGAGGSGSNAGAGGAGNVFASDDMGARVALQRDNVKEYDRQFKASGFKTMFDRVPAKK